MLNNNFPKTRLSRRKLVIPQNTELKLEGNFLQIKGSKLEQSLEVYKGLSVNICEDSRTVKVEAISFIDKSLIGTFYSKLFNAMNEVNQPYSENIELKGVGYKAFMAKAGSVNVLVLNVGKSHLCAIEVPDYISLEVKDIVKVSISGSKDDVTFFADQLKRVRPWDACKRAGIVRQSEIPFLIKKSGKKN